MFSIIIPIYDEEKNIEFLINEILFNLKKYKNFEIIVVDDSSKDSSLEILIKSWQRPTLPCLKTKYHRR